MLQPPYFIHPCFCCQTLEQDQEYSRKGKSFLLPSSFFEWWLYFLAVAFWTLRTIVNGGDKEFLCLWLFIHSFFKTFFDVDHFLKFLLNIVSVLCFGFWLRGMCDLSSPTSNPACTTHIVRGSLNHWTSREFPFIHSFFQLSPMHKHHIWNKKYENSYISGFKDSQFWGQSDH